MKNNELGDWGENQTHRILKKNGFDAYLSPGSRGPADVPAFKVGKRWMIQVKARNNDDGILLNNTEIVKLVDHSLKYDCTPVVAKLLPHTEQVLNDHSNQRHPNNPSRIINKLGNYIGDDVGNGFLLTFYDVGSNQRLEP